MSVLNWFFDDQKKPEKPATSFQPRIVISPNSTLHIEVEPKDPTTTANIVITAFASKQVRTIVPICVKWFRFKINATNSQAIQQLHCLLGSTYMCEPSDVGGYVRAEVHSAGDMSRIQAEVTIGPIGIDPMIKRLLDGGLYSGSLLSQVSLVEIKRKCNITVRLYSHSIQFIEDNTQKKLVKEYTMSEPKIELNPKDPTRVYMRFQQDMQNVVRQWLNSVFGIKGGLMDESVMSVRVPYSTHSSNSSKLKLFQKSHQPCVNKLQIRFLSRHSRDLFLFTQRAFICREDMRNSIYVQRIETLQNISNDADYFKFLEYMSLKYEIWRLGDYAKEVENDRDSKVKDLINMEESIAEMTLTYLKIIQEKAKHSHLELEQSYSQINNTRDDVLQRRNLRELKTQNQNLKQRLREMSQQLQLQKFFKPEDNASIMINQTSNPFAKKPLQLSMSYQALSPDKTGRNTGQQRNNMYEMSINYANLMQENRALKSQLKKYKTGMKVKNQKSQDMMQILGSLDQNDDNQTKIVQLEKQVSVLNSQKQEMQTIIAKLQDSLNNSKIDKIGSPQRYKSTSFVNEPSNFFNQSIMNQSNISGITESFLNQSLTSQAAMLKLQQNLRNLSELNGRLNEDNTRLRRERDQARKQVGQLKTALRQMQLRNQGRSGMVEDSMIFRSKEEFQVLQNQKNALQRKLESLQREGSWPNKQEAVRKDKVLREIQGQLQRLRKEKTQLIRQIQNMNKGNNSQQLQIYQNQNIRLKKINGQLLQQIRSLKIQLQKRSSQDMYNSRVIQLQNQLSMAMANSPRKGESNYLDQINQLSKQVARLKQDNQDKQSKLEHQMMTIDKLVVENRKTQNTAESKQSSSAPSTTSKEKSYSQRCSQATAQQLQKYKREVKKLQQQIIFIKKSSDALNRSRDLTLQMDGYYQQKVDIMRKQIEQLCQQNQNLSKMCERYARDAKQSHKELEQFKQKYQNMLKMRTQQSVSFVSNA